MLKSLAALLTKAHTYDLNWQNVFSYAAIVLGRKCAGLSGILRLRLKAFLFGVEVGPRVECFGPIILGRWPGSKIVIRAGAGLISTARRATASTIYAPLRLRTYGREAEIIIGEGAQLSGTSIAARSTRVTVGKNTMIGPNCVIVDSDFHAHWPPQTRHLEPGLEYDAPVSIGDNVWIGMGSTILKGVSIGDGAVVGAGSLVTRSIPPYAMAVGVPARVIRSMQKEKFVLLDRDGTIMVDGHYLSKPEDVALMPGAAEGLKLLAEAGYRLIVVTNQSGIGRGLYTEASMHAVNERLKELLREHGVEISAIYFCPHSPEDKCSCRKPESGMLERASKDFAFDPAQSLVIGDKACDVDLGLSSGAKSILVLTGYGQKQDESVKSRASFVAGDLKAAAEWILMQSQD